MSDHYQLKNLMINKFYACLISWIFECRTLCKSPEVNWLKSSDVVWGTRLDYLFFSRRPGTNSTGGLK